MKWLGVLVLVLCASAARSEVIQGTTELTCSDRRTLVEVLDTFDEQPLLRGLSRQGPVVIYANKRDRTWTIVQRMDTDLYCVIAMGQAFEPVPEQSRELFLRERKALPPQ